MTNPKQFLICAAPSGAVRVDVLVQSESEAARHRQVQRWAGSHLQSPLLSAPAAKTTTTQPGSL